MQTFFGILTIINGLIIFLSSFAPNPNSTIIKLGTFWPDYAGSWLLIAIGVPEDTAKLLAIGLALLTGLCMVFAGLGILEIINFGSLIEEFVGLSIILSLCLFIAFFQPFVVIGIIFDVIIVLYMMFR